MRRYAEALYSFATALPQVWGGACPSVDSYSYSATPQKPQITYLFYPGFDKEPHPALHTSMAIGLRDLHVRYRDYDQDNPPLLHQKDQLVTEDYPGYAKFAKLSQQERKWSLLDDPKTIFDRLSWEQCLATHGAALRGHRLVRQKP